MNNAQKISWHDSYAVYVAKLAVPLMCMIFLTGIFVKSPKDIEAIIVFVLVNILLMLGTILSSLSKPVKLNDEGIEITHTPIKSLQIPNKVFLPWTEIKMIKIFRKARALGYATILNIKTNDRIHESFIADPRGLLHVIEDLNKESLLDKNSKYLWLKY